MPQKGGVFVSLATHIEKSTVLAIIVAQTKSIVSEEVKKYDSLER